MCDKDISPKIEISVIHYSTHMLKMLREAINPVGDQTGLEAARRMTEVVLDEVLCRLNETLESLGRRFPDSGKEHPPIELEFKKGRAI